ncbi:MAG TPA: 1-(5-phosphoribosyl)-5-[(5-phosphoribosylamino)methylideneamino]imidazole-4-carboxamide isomerase [Solirubrobacteraceae bacterium]|nr:1-(5-phosphoribosyl)-5-[(5-phosphoribosylamino)methylideneamino]imidazole-4-carboxamide isomerase [Solirubrobacteraceae bacterium]
MKLYPAVDILAGKAVRLVRGDYEQSRVYEQDPVAAARGWVLDGAEYLHVVDLDGARRGEPVNVEHVRAIAAACEVPVQYGGGLRTVEAVAQALEAGAERVILGTAAFEEHDLLERALAEHGPERVLVGVDVRGGLVATHGWTQTTEVRAREAFAYLLTRGARSFVFTNIDRDGMLDGPNAEEVEWVSGAVGDGCVILSGGIGTLEDLGRVASLRGERGLEHLDGVIVGTALYERRFTVADAVQALAA